MSVLKRAELIIPSHHDGSFMPNSRRGSEMNIKILLVDDHEIVLDSLCALIEKEPDMEVVGRARDGHMAVRMARELSPDIIIMDIGMPNLNGIESTFQITAKHPGIKTIALSVYGERRFVARMLKAGAKGYLIKNNAYQQLVHAIRTVKDNRIYLSPEIAGTVATYYLNQESTRSLLSEMEREVIKLFAEGKTDRQTASCLKTDVKTVEMHHRNVMDKLKVHTMAELIEYAVGKGFDSLVHR